MFRLIQVAVLCFALAFSLAVWGQSFGGRIVGMVTDSTGAVIPGVSVTAVNEGSGAQRRLTTDDGGTYVASELPVGFYTVRFEELRR